MPTFAVNPELIRWAIDRSGVPVDELRDIFKKIDDWLSGERQQTFRVAVHGFPWRHQVEPRIEHG